MLLNMHKNLENVHNNYIEVINYSKIDVETPFEKKIKNKKPSGLVIF